MDTLIALFGQEFLRRIKWLLICGVFGDPAAGLHTMDIIRWFRRHNPLASISLHTNGGVRNAEWWTELARLLRHPRDHVTFSIDGLEDTNHIYRRNVDWQRVMTNAQTFIDAGGPAHWDMLAFEHNEHQIQQAEQLAKSMGFHRFRVKVSTRNNSPDNKQVAVSPKWEIRSIPNSIKSDPDWAPKTDVSHCPALAERSLYVAANGEVMPCCQLGKEVFAKNPRLENLLATADFQGFIDSWNSPDPYSTCGTCMSEAGRNKWKYEAVLK